MIFYIPKKLYKMQAKEEQTGVRQVEEEVPEEGTLPAAEMANRSLFLSITKTRYSDLMGGMGKAKSPYGRKRNETEPANKQKKKQKLG